LKPEDDAMAYCKRCGSELPEGAAFCPKCGTAVEIVIELKLAFWGERFVAWLIDVIILGVFIAVIELSMRISWPGYTWVPYFPRWIPFVDFGLSNLVYFMYWTLMDGLYGQSVGKMLMGIRVASLNDQQPSVGQSALESVGKAYLLPLDCILGWALYPRKRQRMFNYLSGTIVVEGSKWRA
jgi:uncharacterized RDD family membrane protein YckC